jgi:anti-sigma regulatory factor (Ser/Thr protein kinase)
MTDTPSQDQTWVRDPEPAGQGWSARALLPAIDRSPLTARRLVSTLLVAWGYGDQVELTELVVSELVSNAVRHAGDAGDLELELSADDDVIRLWVADGSPEPAVLGRTAPLPAADREQPEQPEQPGESGQSTVRPSGLGLQLVDRVATRWGVEDYLFGKRVWVELPARSGS